MTVKGSNFGQFVTTEKKSASFILHAELGLVQKGAQEAHDKKQLVPILKRWES